MIIVQRAPADKPGEDIVSSVLVSVAAQVERGRQEINYNSIDRVIKTGAVVASEFITPGAMVSVQNQDGVAIGMLTEFAISIEHGKCSTEIIVECLK